MMMNMQGLKSRMSLFNTRVLGVQQSMSFARHANKAQKVSQDMKYDMSAYEYVPETINRLTPHPNYPDPAMPTSFWKAKKKQMTTESLERLRTAGIHKKIKERNYN